MRSRTPKLLHPICGRPMIGWVVDAARQSGAGKIVVVDAPGEPLRRHLAEDIHVAIQHRHVAQATRSGPRSRTSTRRRRSSCSTATSH